MTSYGAYDAGLPCKNTACKSHGKPHPNCRCYGDMAEGGDVAPYCDKSQDHLPACEYYSKGGVVGTLANEDPHHSVAGHFLHSGLTGVLKMSRGGDIEKYDSDVKKGHKGLDRDLEAIFNHERPAAIDDRSKHHKHIDDWVSEGSITDDIMHEIYNQNGAQNFAEGGKVEKHPKGVLHNHPIEHAYPEQNIILQAAKGRASNYLSALRPQENSSKLPFDDAPDQTEKKKAYNKARKIADSPKSILREISNGTLDPEHVQHLNAIYPEVSEAMQKKITEKIIHSQLKGKKPPRHVRQGLSLLMGAPLSGDLTPQGILAAQAVFAKAPAAPEQKAAPDKPKKSTSSLSKSDKSFLTGDQAREMRQQRVT